MPKKATYAVVGREPGPSKMAKISENKIPILDEDAFYKLIESAPAQDDELPADMKPKGAAAKVCGGCENGRRGLFERHGTTVSKSVVRVLPW